MTQTSTVRADFEMVLIDAVHESHWNPRRHYDPAKLAELAESIRQHGILTPLTVRPHPDLPEAVEVGAGHRRLRAAKLAGLDRVPCIVRDLDDDAFRELLILENLNREDLHPLEEAEGYRSLRDEGGFDVPGIAANVGKSTSYVYQRLQLLQCTPEVQEAMWAGQVPLAHALHLARVPADVQAKGLETLRRDLEGWRKALPPADEFGEHLRLMHFLPLAKAPFAMDDAALMPEAGACLTCPKRTGFLPDLFPEVGGEDLCTDAGCFRAKQDAFAQRTLTDLRAEGHDVVQLTDRWGQRRPQGDKPIPAGVWKESKAKSGTVLGVFTRGDRAGEVIRVKVPEPEPEAVGKAKAAKAEPKGRDADEAKRKDTALANRRELAARLLVARAALPLIGKDNLHGLVRLLVADDMGLATPADELEAFGLYPAPPAHYQDPKRGTWAQALTPDQLARYLAATLATVDLEADTSHGWSPIPEVEVLPDLCALVGLGWEQEIGEARSSVAAGAAEEAKAPAKKGKKGKR